ncbi:prepilin-type N-terminal cleavage/methylation domain-containing protein [Thiomicrorhabdus sp. zzn3]|uniref:type II secretion system protein n=1 Tax=Thiomicrorhabdus sp. zzn3 TaxID=3039775 RepID=UPI002437025A|nr:prepilin-type N-terminal cleavage/methylation domain-containing protein [Thiomicrorhabdus sp. zzn3]MDG6777340.1 prepilin-type N-terminal cleavage/methylation domain-containing protein [Thiomicrorhabdus sp. zzn3]
MARYSTIEMRQKGFTLLEVITVLLIVGLLVTGIFKAMALIDNVKLQRDIKFMKGLHAAYFLYKDRYGRMPGEDLQRPGRLKTILSTQDAPSEGLFYDLYQAGFTKELVFQPNIGQAFKATWGGSSGANYGLIAGQNQLCITEVEVDLAQWMEAKMDDSNRSQGDVEYTLNGSQLCMLLS